MWEKDMKETRKKNKRSLMSTANSRQCYQRTQILVSHLGKNTTLIHFHTIFSLAQVGLYKIPNTSTQARISQGFVIK
jgi:hypothetical protein